MNENERPTVKQVRDVVCGMIIDPLKAAATIDHGAHAHYFCSEKCRLEFEKDPKKYH